MDLKKVEFIVIHTGHPATVKLLIDSGASVNHEDENGDTALIWAATYGDFFEEKNNKNTTQNEFKQNTIKILSFYLFRTCVHGKDAN